MKKTAILSLALGSLGSMAVFFIALPVHAQIILPFSQGQQNVSDDQFFSDHAGWSIQIPHLSFTGTTTGAFLVFDTDGLAYDRNYQSATVNLTCGATSAGWTTDSAVYWGNIITNNEPHLLSTGSAVFFDVQDETCTIAVDFTKIAGHPVGWNYFGQASSTHPTWVVTGSGTGSGVGVPYFSFPVNGFFITPTTTDSGIFLSGAQGYCNDVFASSTGIGATISNGLCVALGFLFIPTPGSISQFAGLNDALAEHVPFSYVYAVAGDVDTLTASSTANLPTWTVPLSQFPTSTVTGSFSDLTILSTSTISKYFPDSARLSFLFIERSAIWFGVIFAFYRRIVPHKVKI